MISPSQNINTNTYVYKNIPFGAGKVYLWLDNDGTLIPYTKSDELDYELQDPRGKERLQKYFDRLDSFVQKSNGSVHLNITTGKPFDAFSNKVKKILAAGVKYIVPEKVVVNDGGDQYLNPEKTKPESPWNSFSSLMQKIIQWIKGLTGDQTRQTSPENNIQNNLAKLKLNPAKRDEIIKNANWDLDYIKSSLRKVLTQNGYKVFDEEEYRQKRGDKRLGEFFNQYHNESIAIINTYGDFKLYIRLSPGKEMQYGEFNSLKNQLKGILKSKKISYNMEDSIKDTGNSGRPGIILTPKVNGHNVDKSYDVFKAIQKAKRENDLIIVAGNDRNDLPMLSPKTYKSLMPREELPLRGIVVLGEHRNYRNPATQLANDPANKGFITKTQPFGLLGAIKQSIRQYAENNPAFKKALNPEIVRELETKNK